MRRRSPHHLSLGAIRTTAHLLGWYRLGRLDSHGPGFRTAGQPQSQCHDLIIRGEELHAARPGYHDPAAAERRAIMLGQQYPQFLRAPRGIDGGRPGENDVIDGPS